MAVSASGKQKYHGLDSFDRDNSTFSTIASSLSETTISEKLNEKLLPTSHIQTQDQHNSFNTLTNSNIDDTNDTINSYCNEPDSSLPNISTASSFTHIKRYKMERKNSQQSQHGKQELASNAEFKFNNQSECDSNYQSLINDKGIQVKIADLGNACYEVSVVKYYSFSCAFICN